MLLPSTLGCDAAFSETTRPLMRPKLPSFGVFQPQASTSSQPPHGANPIASSCRALHAILGSQSPSLAQSNTPQLTRELANPFAPVQQPARPRRISRVQRDEQHESRPAQACRGANKRRRSTFEQDLNCADTVMQDQFELGQRTPPRLRTPKRRRRVPLAMPLGLSADDFRALETPLEECLTDQEDLNMPTVISPPRNLESSTVDRDGDGDSAYGSSPSIDDAGWSVDDDRILVEMVLEKLRLSKRDWNDCARRLGKDKDSLGRRWSLLVGEGNVGLRRGGRTHRPDLDIASW
ncbi:hypothetical protein PV10_05665 [Exophiala mesophila]|uniref:Myb-like domain-containing protein n=1 Tax=Exophiala mesophila TaxID=212818 RepID=A0A0D1ZWC4_EXOME|nr:uncharacterized protein PV10_05665 [Exophiala mesophila]KIV91083.1 hypothetical protein PV10_05665 [Exophiala mesophila]